MPLIEIPEVLAAAAVDSTSTSGELVVSCPISVSEPARLASVPEPVQLAFPSNSSTTTTTATIPSETNRVNLNETNKNANSDANSLQDSGEGRGSESLEKVCQDVELWLDEYLR